MHTGRIFSKSTLRLSIRSQFTFIQYINQCHFNMFCHHGT